MNWLPWGRKKKFDFNAFLVSKAKQQKQEENYKLQQKDLDNDAGNKEDDAKVTSSMALMRKRASAKAQTFSTFMNQPKSFSLVLTDEDLKGLELQRKLETLRRQGEDAKKMHREEKEVMTRILGESKKQLAHKLRDGIDWSEYLEIAQQEIAAMEAEQRHKEHKQDLGDGDNDNDDDEEYEGSAGGSMSSVQGRQEADLMKAMHKVELQERTRKRLQEFTNDEILLMYKMESTIKEDFAEREAKILSRIAKADSIVGEFRQCHEARADVYARMVARYEKEAELHMQRVYKALRDQSSTGTDDQEEDGELKVRARSKMLASTGSYSSRILAVNAQEKEASMRNHRTIMSSLSEDEMPEVEEEEESEDEEENDDSASNSTSNVDEKDESHSNSDDIPRAPRESPGSSKSPSLRRYKHLANQSSPSYARSTGASRNTRASGARAATSTASRAAAVAAARSRAAGAAARAAANGGTKPMRAARTATSSAPHRVQSLNASRPARTLTNVQPRRVNSATARR